MLILSVLYGLYCWGKFSNTDRGGKLLFIGCGYITVRAAVEPGGVVEFDAAGIGGVRPEPWARCFVIPTPPTPSRWFRRLRQELPPNSNPEIPVSLTR